MVKGIKVFNQLYSSEEELRKSNETGSTEENVVDVRKIVFIIEVPRVAKLNVHDQKDVEDIFGEFEKYC